MISSLSVISRITRHGFPAARQLSGISLVTTLPAPITQPFPMVIPPVMVTFAAIRQLFPIVLWACRIQGRKAAVFAHIGYKLSDYLGTLFFLVLKGVIKHFAQLVSLYSQVGKLLVRWGIELSCQHFSLFGHMLLLLRLCVLLLYSFKRTGNFFDDLSVNALLSLTDSVVKCLSVGASVCLDNRL